MTGAARCGHALARLPGGTATYTAIDRGEVRLLEDCVAPRVLCLKLGALVLCLKNLDFAGEVPIINGSVGVVVGSELVDTPLAEGGAVPRGAVRQGREDAREAHHAVDDAEWLRGPGGGACGGGAAAGGEGVAERAGVAVGELGGLGVDEAVYIGTCRYAGRSTAA